MGLTTAELAPLPLLPYTPSRDEIDALQKLGRLMGPGELRAAVLALIAKPGSSREKQAWREETAHVPNAASVRAEVRKLSRATRAPALDRALRAFAQAPAPERRKLLASARRVMSGDGQVRPLDRLRWLTMHHLLGEEVAREGHADLRGPSANAVSKLVDAQRSDIATFTAFLARLVPMVDARAAVGGAGARWYQTVLERWWEPGTYPACQVPDPDTLVRALWGVQELSWMLHPVLIRTWVDEAVRTSEPRVLRDEAAEALRLTCALLNTPMPPVLAKSFVECPE